MCKVLRTIGADVLDAELPVGQADTAFTLRGDLRDPGLDAELGHIVDALVGAALDGRGRAAA